jgi:hypothetical protein
VWNIIARHWNWKASLLSSLFRASIFFTANLSAGTRAAVAAMVTELAYRGFTSGICGALTQRMSRIQPVWRAALMAFGFLPILQHSLELMVHFLRGTPNLRLSISVSVLYTGCSTVANLFLMRKGVLVVGEGSQSLRQDLISLGRLALSPMWRGPAGSQGEA